MWMEKEVFVMSMGKSERCKFRLLITAVIVMVFFLCSGIVSRAEKDPAVEVTYVNGDVVPYSTFAEATENLSGARTIVLLEDVESTHQVVIPEGTEVTLDLNGYGITRTAGMGIFLVQGQFTLTDTTVLNETAEKKEMYVGDDHLGHMGNGSEDQLKYTVKGGYITGGGGTSCGGAVAVDGGTFTMEAGVIYGCVAEGSDLPFVDVGDYFYDGGGAVFVVSGEFVMNGGYLIGNKADATSRRAAGGAVGMLSGTLTVNKGVIVGNYAGYFGGGVYVKGEATFGIYAYIKGNEAINGGAIYVDEASTVNMDRLAVLENTATRGGAIYTEGTLTIEGAKIKNNSARYGGAIATGGSPEGYSELILKDVMIYDNTSDNCGAVMVSQYVDLHMSGEVEICGNKTGDKESNLYFLGENHIILDGPMRRGNGLGIDPSYIDLSDGYGRQITVYWNEYMKGTEPEEIFTLDDSNYKLGLGTTNEVFLLDANARYRDVSFLLYPGEEVYYDFKIATTVERFDLPAKEIPGRILKGWTVNGEGEVYELGEEYTFAGSQDITFVAASDEGYLMVYEPLVDSIPDNWSQDGDKGWRSTGLTAVHSTVKGTKSRLITEPLDLSEAEEAILTFYFINSDTGEKADTLDVSYRVNGGEWSEPFITIDEPYGEYYYCSEILPKEALASGVELGFQATIEEGQTVGLMYVSLVVPGHHFNYLLSDNGDGITAICANAPRCDVGGEISLSILAPEMKSYMDGKSALATLENLDEFNEATGLDLSAEDIVYKDAEGKKLAAAPTAPGKYTASINVISDAEIYIEYRIKASYEWVKGIWYNKDGSQTYKYKAEWKKTAKGWKYVDEAGKFPKNTWSRIDGKWYFFDAGGIMESNCYRQGWYLTKSGAWGGVKAIKGWKKTGSG